MLPSGEQTHRGTPRSSHLTRLLNSASLKARSLRTTRSTFHPVSMSMTLNCPRRRSASRAASSLTGAASGEEPRVRCQLGRHFGQREGQQQGAAGPASQGLAGPSAQAPRRAGRRQDGPGVAPVDEALDEQPGLAQVLRLIEQQRPGLLDELLQLAQEQRGRAAPPLDQVLIAVQHQGRLSLLVEPPSQQGLLAGLSGADHQVGAAGVAPGAPLGREPALDEVSGHCRREPGS